MKDNSIGGIDQNGIPYHSADALSASQCGTRYIVPILVQHSMQYVKQPEQLQHWNIWHQPGWEHVTHEMELTRYYHFPFLLSGVLSRLFVALLQRQIESSLKESLSERSWKHLSANGSSGSSSSSSNGSSSDTDDRLVNSTVISQPFYSLMQYWNNGFYLRENTSDDKLPPTRIMASVVADRNQPYGKVLQLYIRGHNSVHELKNCHFILQRQIQSLYSWLWTNHIEPNLTCGVAFVTVELRKELAMNRREAIRHYLAGLKEYTCTDISVPLTALLPEIVSVEQQYPRINVAPAVLLNDQPLVAKTADDIRLRETEAGTINELYKRYGENIQVVNKLGEGQFGVVWSGYHDKAVVAIKIFKYVHQRIDIDAFIRGILASTSNSLTRSLAHC
jgi:hypothetical protein